MEELQSQAEQAEETIQLQELFYWCLRKWYWFVISLFITFTLATIYLLKAVPVYTRSAELLIKEETKGSSFSSNLEQNFSDMGLFKSSTNVHNEILAIKSLNMVDEVVARLRLHISYQKDGRFHRELLYGTSLPLMVQFIDQPNNTSSRFTLICQPTGRVQLKEMAYGPDELDEQLTVSGQLGDTLQTPFGRIQVLPTPYYKLAEPLTLYVSHASLRATARGYASALEVSLIDKNATVLRLSLKDVCPQRAEDVLNTVIAVYNENWVKDKNEIAISTSSFINERLAEIERDLGDVDQNISNFKSKNLLPDVQAASTMYMTQNSQTNSQLLALNSQLYMTRYIRRYVTNVENKGQLLPANSGIENSNIESQITQYNTKLLQRNNLVANSSDKNPLVVDLDRSLSAMSKAIVISIDNQLETLKAQIESLVESEAKTTHKIAASPSQAKYLLSVERQQKVKEALYLFLLQKREENDLSQAFSAYNTRIMTSPNGADLPTSPVRNMIYLVALVMGLMIPVAIIFFKEYLNTKIRGRNDLDGLDIPFIGEIPQYNEGKKHQICKKNKEENIIVVKEGHRDIINEAFRILRTNLEFMTEKNGHNNVMLLTSYNQGSGKSFLTMNLALSLAIKQKKVLVIDGDLRYAATSSYVNSPKQGLSSYLNGYLDQWKDLLVPDATYNNLHVLPVGILPPNPTELLFHNRLKSLIDESKKLYDYVLIDCPPIEVVADVQIIENYVDRTIFVIRAGLLERRMLDDLQRIYHQNTYKNMVLVLNGTASPSGYYDYKYAYRSSYHYGHNLKKFPFSKGYRHRSTWVIK